MKTILVPIDGSDASLRALQAAITMIGQQSQSSVIHVLNVQAPVISHNAARFFSAEVLKDYYEDAGQTAIHAATELLKNSGINYHTHVQVGHITDEVKKYIAQHQCDHIVMGTRGLSAMPGLLLGSVATKILHSVDIPITLIK